MEDNLLKLGSSDATFGCNRAAIITSTSKDHSRLCQTQFHVFTSLLYKLKKTKYIQSALMNLLFDFCLAAESLLAFPHSLFLEIWTLE